MTATSTPYKWLFQARFRKGAFGWRGSRAAAERIGQAVSEIKKAAKTDPMLGAEGAIRLLRQLSPALENIDSSSGAIGSAVNGAIAALVPVIADANADERTRRKWLEHLWKALMDDQIPYIERLGDYWGELCAIPAVAWEWADLLLPSVIATYEGGGSYNQGSDPCFGALLVAKRYEEIIDVLERAPRPSWHNRRWGFRALVAQGRRAEALRYAQASLDKARNDTASIARACEELLIESRMPEEAYERFAMAAVTYESTYLARFRALRKKYPGIAPSRVLTDLVATTPGSEGKWFAAAKHAGLYEDAIELVQGAPCDPKTLGRAARDFREKRPAFALEAAVAALHWYAQGHGYDCTNADIAEAYRSGLEAAVRLDLVGEFDLRVNVAVAQAGEFVLNALVTVRKSR
jgi:hypothetical protein